MKSNNSISCIQRQLLDRQPQLYGTEPSDQRPYGAKDAFTPQIQALNYTPLSFLPPTKEPTRTLRISPSKRYNSPAYIDWEVYDPNLHYKAGDAHSSSTPSSLSDIVTASLNDGVQVLQEIKSDSCILVEGGDSGDADLPVRSPTGQPQRLLSSNQVNKLWSKTHRDASLADGNAIVCLLAKKPGSDEHDEYLHNVAHYDSSQSNTIAAKTNAITEKNALISNTISQMIADNINTEAELHFSSAKL